MTAVIEWLGGGAKCTDGEDPPDCYLVLDGEKVAVEVTRLAPLSFDATGAPKNRTSEDEIPMRICDRLDRGFGAQLPSGLNLLLLVHGPLRDPHRFTRSAEAQIRTLIDSAAIRDGYNEIWELAGNKVDAIVVTRISPTGRKIVGAILNHDAVVWMEGEAIAALHERIAHKEALMARLSWRGPRWLVLLNAHPFLGPTEYCAAYRNMCCTHGFARVILVHRDGTVCDLAVA